MGGDKKLLMIPGPIEFSDAVLEAGRAIGGISHVDPRFIQTFGDTLRMLRDVAVTKTAQPFVVAGSGTVGWDMTAVNVLEDGDRALVVSSGYFGTHFRDCLEAYGADVTILEAEAGHAVSAEVIGAKVAEAKMAGKPFKLVTLTHVDTSTGVRCDVEAVAKAIRVAEPATLIAVDSVCAFAAQELRMDDWGVDVIITGSQKALGVPPGLAVVVVSRRTLEAVAARKTPVRSYFHRWSNWAPIMAAYEAGKPSYFATPPCNLIYSLHQALKEIEAAGGAAAVFARHEKVAGAFKTGVAALGLGTLPATPDLESVTLTNVWVPEGKELGAMLGAIKEAGVVVAGGLLAPIKTRYFRVGHMGYSVISDGAPDVRAALAAIETALKAIGADFTEGAGVAAFDQAMKE